MSVENGIRICATSYIELNYVVGIRLISLPLASAALVRRRFTASFSPGPSLGPGRLCGTSFQESSVDLVSS